MEESRIPQFLSGNQKLTGERSGLDGPAFSHGGADVGSTRAGCEQGRDGGEDDERFEERAESGR